MDNNNNNNTTDMLHALADGQLPAHEREKILALIDKDKELSGEVCDIYHLKDLIQTAYPLDDFAKAKQNIFLSKYGFSIKVASYFFAFLLTLSSGYFIGNSINTETALNQYVAAAPVQQNKTIVFLSSSEPAKLTQALYKAEILAKEHQKSNGEVYVVTSAQGIDLLNTNTTPYQQKIMELSDQYPSLKFIACNNTLYQLRKSGKEIDLVVEAEVVPSAVDFVAKHLQQGWQYITI